ncbi:MAG: hypothetical protein WB868_21565 [Xanthobacteraceae bacterium]
MPTLPPLPIKLPPGFFRNGTAYESAGRYYDGNLVRWQNGRIVPWGGWVPVFSGGAAFTGIARGALTWRANNGNPYGAIGTNTNLYIGTSGIYDDVTPGDLVAGRADSIAGPGYGVAGYGQQSYGTGRIGSDAITLSAATWSMDSYGEVWIGVLNSDGRILTYDPTTDDSVAALENAPTNNQAVMVTNEEYVLAIGAGGNGRIVQWPDQNDNTNWTPSGTSTAGNLILRTQGNLQCGKLFGTQTLLFTDLEVHALTFAGYPDIYGVEPLGQHCGVVSPNAVAQIPNAVVWLGPTGFWFYNGFVQPLPCEVQDYIFGTSGYGINTLQLAKVYAGVNSQKYEVTWFYPDASNVENNRYVTMNYQNWPNVIFYFGELARTCWLDAGVFPTPQAVDPSGNYWAHEVGYLANGQPRSEIFLTSGPVELGTGDRVIYANGLLPDVQLPASLQVSIAGQMAPNGPSTTFGPYPISPNVYGFSPGRFCGRQVAVSYQQIVGQDGAWSIGKNRAFVAQGGKR